MKHEQLIYGYLMQSLTSEEEETFVALMADDKSFAQAYEHAQQVWDASSQATFPSGVSFDAAKGWDAIAQTNQPVAIQPLKRNYFKSFYRVAAVVLLVLSATFIVKTISQDDFVSGEIVETFDNSKIYGLTDGSHVYIDNQSKLNIDKQFNRSSRKVRLNGKAFFVVKPDKDRVFEVVTNHLTATVKGTTFLIRTDDHSSSVGVNTGIVEVHVGNQTVTLTAGDQIDFTAENGGVVTRSLLDSENLKSFKQKVLNYYDTPLKVILEDLKESTGLVVKAPKSIENQRFTMELSSASTKEIIETIELVTNRKAVKKGQSYTLF